MIVLLDPGNAQRYPGMREAMLELRHARLSEISALFDGQDVEHVDHLDRLDANNLLYLDPQGRVQGCVRLLQTMGPHSLSTEMSSLIGGDHPLRNPCVWEMSRVCVPSRDAGSDRRIQRLVLAELILATIDLALASGVSDVLAILDNDTASLLPVIGLFPEGKLGHGFIDGCHYEVFVLACTRANAAMIRASCKLQGDIWDVPEAVLEIVGRGHDAGLGQLFRDALRGEMPRDLQMRLQAYCAGQLLSAQTEEERAAALRLMQALMRLMGGTGEDSDPAGH